MQSQANMAYKASGGLETLAAAASHRSENNGTEEVLDSKDERNEKHDEPSKAQKGKVRKAYTITKQRERWTDGEHDRFLQALKRYGRAWRKIEEHIGTKTAVQIRSHAQKFFSKLQRERSMSDGLGEESSKAGISIPPPRPKRKPSHPYPRKYNGSSENEQSADADAEKERNASTPAQPSSDPSCIQPQAHRPAAGSNADMSLSQILESAAAAAAFAWSQVVSNAAPKVQQQLQAQVAAHQNAQTLQPFFGMQQLQPNTAVLQGLAAKMQPMHSLQETMAKNLASSSQHLSNQFLPPSSQGRSMYSSASPANLRHFATDRSSPEACGNGTPAGTEKDCASSREHSKDFGMPGRPRTVSPYQGMPQYWSGIAAPSSEMRLGRAALNLMARSHVQHPVAIPAQQRAPIEVTAYRGLSAGFEFREGQPGTRLEKPKPVKVESPEHGKLKHASQGCSDISQLAHFYQQAAAQEQQIADNGENGSSAGGEGGSGSGGGSTNGEKRSDKGSANNNTSGSDETGSGQLHGSDGGNALDLYAKGSDDGSNSPNDGPHRSPKKELEDKPGLQPSVNVFSMAADPTGLASSSTQWQQLPTIAAQASLETQAPQALSQVLSQQQMAAYQQQALQAWAATAQQSLPNYQILQSMLGSTQSQKSGGHSSEANNLAPISPGVKTAALEPRSSDVPSMDTFNANTRSFSVPTFNLSEGKKQSSILSTSKPRGEEQSGFKPYSKKHGMPISSLPPSKRFAASTAVDRPVAVKAHCLYTPFGSLNAQAQAKSPAS